MRVSTTQFAQVHTLARRRNAQSQRRDVRDNESGLSLADCPVRLPVRQPVPDNGVMLAWLLITRASIRPSELVVILRAFGSTGAYQFGDAITAVAWPL